MHLYGEDIPLYGERILSDGCHKKLLPFNVLNLIENSAGKT